MSINSSLRFSIDLSFSPWSHFAKCGWFGNDGSHIITTFSPLFSYVFCPSLNIMKKIRSSLDYCDYRSNFSLTKLTFLIFFLSNMRALPASWNNLPKTLCAIKCLIQFKYLLRTLFKFTVTYPIHHYLFSLECWIYRQLCSDMYLVMFNPVSPFSLLLILWTNVMQGLKTLCSLHPSYCTRSRNRPDGFSVLLFFNSAVFCEFALICEVVTRFQCHLFLLLPNMALLTQKNCRIMR